MTCSTTDPQAQEAARGLGGAAASTRGRAVGSLLAGEIADDEAAITTAATAVRCIVLLWAARGGAGGSFDKLVSRRQAGSAAGRPVRATISHELGMYVPKTLQAARRKSELASVFTAAS